MAKPDLGTKRVCPDTGRKFYDLNKTPVISPYTGKVVPIAAPAPPRSRPEPAAAARPAPVAPTESIVPETADAEFVSLEDAEAEQQGKKPAAADAKAEAGEEEEVEIGDESMDDAAFIEEQEEGDADVTDIIGESIEKEEES
ncbi:MAG: TIGR02300 family protein [Pseudolabrys sp.]|nr:TIGR02300 family protein [Pseudolabrys sp.]